MKFKTKLYIGFITIALLSAILGVGLLFYKYQQLVIHDFKTKVLTAGVTASSLLDSERLSQIRKPEDQKSLAYEKISHDLLKIISANQKAALYISYIYTLMPDPERPGRLMFGIDADQNPKEVFAVGHPYQGPDEKDIVNHLNAPWGREDFIEDNRGLWFSAYSPVFDKQGKYVATLGVDLRAEDVNKELRQVAIYTLMGLIAGLIPAFLIAYFLAKFFNRSLGKLCASMEKIQEGKLEKIKLPHTHDEFQTMAKVINKMTKGLRERERLKLGFSRYVSQHILDKIIKSDTLPKFAGERKKITVLFSDIRNFTLLAESLPPEEMVAILNEYFESMIEVIFAHQGTLDKFMGDGLMVEFGTPLEDKYQEKHAVLSALEMQKALDKLNEKWQKQNKPTLKVGIGIHTGPAIVGNIGSEKRLEFTAIGDTVNIAARLEQMTKTVDATILISENTFQPVADHINADDLGEVIIKGKTKKIRVYSVKKNPIRHND